MYCVKCGKEIKDGAAFCPYCGTSQAQDKGPSAQAGAANPSFSMCDEEKVILQARLHWMTMMPYLPLAVLALFVSAFMGTGLFLLGIIAAVSLMADPFIKYATTTLRFTNKRLIGKQGFLKTQDLDAPLNKINNVYVNSDLWGKLLGYGELVVSTSSGKYSYKHIQGPEDFKNALMQQIDQFENDQIRKQAMEMAAAMNSSMNAAMNAGSR